MFVTLIPKQALVFTSLQYKSFENSVGKGDIARKQGKGENAGNGIFSFSHNISIFFGYIFHLKLLSIWTSQMLLGSELNHDFSP